MIQTSLTEIPLFQNSGSRKILLFIIISFIYVFNVEQLYAKSCLPHKADELVESVGLSGLSGLADRYQTKLPLLRELGVRYGRTSWAKNADAAKYNDLYQQTGMKLVINLSKKYPPIDEYIRALKKTYNLDLVLALETPNENVEDEASGKRMVAYQKELWRKAKADPRLSHLPILGPSYAQPHYAKYMEDLSEFCDYGNLHSYPTVGLHPGGGRLETWIRMGRDHVFADVPFWATEVGYQTEPDGVGVPESVQAKYVPRLILYYFLKEETEKMFYFNLEGTTHEKKKLWGLCRADFSKKPAYYAFRNLLDLFDDSGAGKDSFSQSPLDFSIQGKTEDVSQALFQKSDGSYWLCLWLGKRSWSKADNKIISYKDRKLQIGFAEQFEQADVFLPTPQPIGNGMEPIQTMENVTSLTVDVNGQLTVIRLLPGKSRSSHSMNWIKEFELNEALKLRDFPEERITYTISPPEKAVKKQHLKLIEVGETKPLVYQLSHVKEDGGFLVSARIHFRTGLAKEETRRFRLEQDPHYQPNFKEWITFKKHKNSISTITANRQSISVPFGKQELDESQSAKIMAPLISIGQTPDDIAAKGLLRGEGTFKFTSLNGEMLEMGPLFCRYRVTYTFSNGGRYQVDLTLQHNESHVLIDEYMEGLKSEKEISFVLDYTDGVNPDGRLAYTMSGYGPLSGTYDKKISDDGCLPLYVGLWHTHNNWVPYSIAFWNDSGIPRNAILFSSYRHRDWVADTHYIWNVKDAPEQLHFYRKDKRKFMRVKLAGKHRHWAVSVIPRDDVVIQGNTRKELVDRPVPPPHKYKVYSDMGDHGQGEYPLGKQSEFGCGPEVKLHQKLTYFSLNWVKDMEFRFEEPLTKYEPEGKEYTFDEYWHEGEDQSSWHCKRMVKTIADMGLARNGRAQFRTGIFYTDYANSRANWTREQREHFRALLVWATHVQERDVMYPHVSLVGGHPNFIADAKFGMAYACALFPDHPHAQKWKSEYKNFLGTWLTDYVRIGEPEMNIEKGRFMENPANYMPASLRRIYEAAEAIHRYDGTNLLADERFRNWMRWTLHTLMPYVHEGEAVMPPPIGAHAVVSRWDRIDNGEDHFGAVYDTAKFMQKQGDTLGRHVLYVLTGGEEGIKPERVSHVWGDYGGVLHYDADGPNHAFVHLFQRGATLGYGNYRYPPHAAGGAIYYAAKGRTWSWNGAEKYGDHFDPHRVTFLRTRKGFLGGLESIEQHGILYNLGDVQYYKALASPARVEEGYLSRAVMMVRDDYIAVYDDLDHAKRESIFQWINEEDGLKQTVYSDMEFKKKVETKINSLRFPTDCDWENNAPVEGMDSDRFSVRWEGAITSAEGLTGDYTFTVELEDGSQDRARLWIDNKPILETTGEDAEATYKLVAGKHHPFKLEYIHHTGEANIKMRFNHPKDSFGSYQARGYAVVHPMPDIHSIRGNVNAWASGDQFHIVAPRNAPVNTSALEHGAIVDGAYVFFSDQNHTYNKNGVTFKGALGYATREHVAVFEGTNVGYQDLQIEIAEGHFGASAKINESDLITGRFAGTQGGILRVSIPDGFDMNGKKVFIDGKETQFEREGQVFIIPIEIKQRDGYRIYAIGKTN